METLAGRRRDPPHGLAGLVRDDQHDRRLLLVLLLAQAVPAREGHRLAFLDELRLLGPPRLGGRLDAVLEVISEDRAESRVGRDIVGLAQASLGVGIDRPERHVLQGLLDGEERALLGQALLADLPERRIIVEDEEPPPERRADEIALAFVDLDVPERDGRDAAAELQPRLAAVERRVDPELRPGEQQVLLDVVLSDRPDDRPLREPPGDVRPGPAAVRAHKKIGLVVARLVIVDGRVDRILVMLGGHDLVDEEIIGDTGYLFDLPPGLAPVLGHLDEAVVGAGVDQAFLEARLAQGRDRPEERHGPMVPEPVDAPLPVHDLLFEPEDAAGQVGADPCP